MNIEELLVDRPKGASLESGFIEAKIGRTKAAYTL